jgi:hypothetical protein
MGVTYVRLGWDRAASGDEERAAKSVLQLHVRDTGEVTWLDPKLAHVGFCWVWVRVHPKVPVPAQRVRVFAGVHIDGPWVYPDP